jgi:hypothetical protein
VLKGADAAIYRILTELPGVSVRLLPVLEKGTQYTDLYNYEETLLEKDCQSGEKRRQDFDGSFETLRNKVFPECAREQSVPETYKQYWNRLGMCGENSQLQWWMKDKVSTLKSHINLAGVELQPLREYYGWECEELRQFEGSFKTAFPLQLLRDVQWLNKENSRELSMMYLAVSKPFPSSRSC